MPESSSLFLKNGPNMKDYKIAGHKLSIDFNSPLSNEELLPNFAPFSCEEDGETLLTISISDNWKWEQNTKGIGHFDVGGNEFRVYRTADNGYQFEIYDTTSHLCSRMQCDPDFKHCNVRLYDGNQNQLSYGLNNCAMLAYAFSSAVHNTILIHSSVIKCNGKGYMMTAPSGTGKSTHTHLWYTNIPDCDLINDDNPIVRIMDGKPVVYGSPWSGKTPCYRNIQAPIGGIVRIVQHNKNTIRQLKAAEAFAILLPACSNMKWDAQVYKGICNTITKIIESCGIWELKCLPDNEAAILCHETICKESHT